MVRKTLGAFLAALLGIAMMTTGIVAQDATPEGDCPATTPEENLQILEDYFDAVIAGDVEAAEALLHDDFSHNLEHPDVPESANEPGNEDELENIDHAADVNHEVTHSVAQNDWVAVYMSFEVSGEHIEGADPEMTATTTAMAMAQIECGMIADAHVEFNALDLLHQFGWEINPPAGD